MIFFWIFQARRDSDIRSPEKIPPELLAVGLQHALLHACVASQWGVDAGKSVEFLQAVSGFVSSYKNCL